MNIRGTVVQKTVAPGSKSEHDAVVLVTEDREYVLRRSGANPFSDPELNKLVDKQLECVGTVHGQYFIMTDWMEVER